MPKNMFPKENMPKMEEVREIDYKMPSLEEFISNYQQEPVNYDDLVCQDISFGKAYGPMPQDSTMKNTEE
jgi:hypothetical protein